MLCAARVVDCWMIRSRFPKRANCSQCRETRGEGRKGGISADVSPQPIFMRRVFIFRDA